MIQHYEDLHRLNQEERNSEVTKMNQQKREMTEEFEESNAQLGCVEEEFTEVQEMVEEMVHKFKAA
jgi:hypothetical protein